METYWKKSECEYLRHLAKQKFDKIKSTWIDLGRWGSPHRIKWLESQTEGERNNNHIVDPTHLVSLRSCVAGFLEGNTSASRPWYKQQGQDPDISSFPKHREWLDKFTRRTLHYLSQSNFYHEAGAFYYDFNVFNTGTHFIEEIEGKLFFHTLVPGSYSVINNGYGEAVILVREMSLTIKALVDTYGKKKDGKWDWSNFSSSVRKLYEDGNYTEYMDIVQIVRENENFDPEKPQAALNKRWVSLTYEVGTSRSFATHGDSSFGSATDYQPVEDKEKFLEITASKRKPFIVGRSQSNGNYEYGEKGPTLDALGLIKSLNKKAISKDQAIEQILRPTLQGPANLKKSYITSVPNAYVPLDPTSLAQKGLRPVFEVNPAIGALIGDVQDLRAIVDKIYFSDYLLYLSRNPKTRTATETNAIVQEQQLVIGPILQSLNWSYNVPIVDYVSSFVLDEDPYLEAPPEELAGQYLRTDFISVFAQAQRAADLPAVDRYISMVADVGQINPKIWDKVNLDKLADIYEDRLYLPAGLNYPTDKVERDRQQALMEQQRQQALQETLPAVAGAVKDMGFQPNKKQE
jgi:uncharacterized protein YfkK (UPF0435 family)